MIFDGMYAFDPYAIVHTILAKRVCHQVCVHMLLNELKI
jgi:hypothetical protein